MQRLEGVGRPIAKSQQDLLRLIRLRRSSGAINGMTPTPEDYLEKSQETSRFPSSVFYSSRPSAVLANG